MPRTAASIAHSAGEHRDQIQFAVAFKVTLTARLWRARFTERMKTPDQTVARWSALYMIADAPLGLTQTQIAERLGIQGPTLVRLIDALEKSGLVSRQPALHDRRAKIVSITDAGRAMLVQIDRSAAEMRNELFTGVTDAELETTLRVLKHLTRQLEPPASDK